MTIKPIVTEKAVRLIESENVLVFQTNMNKTKPEIKQEIEKLFDLKGKIAKIRTHIKANKKYVYIKLKNAEAIDIATKLGLM
jgi:large subunit ribosomal protein L23